MDKSLVILVHGFGSSPATWDKLVELFRKDPALSGFDFDNTFAYPTPWFNYNPFGRIPELSELGNALAAHLGLSRFQPYRKVALIGHSQGGLVIQSYLASKLIAQQGDELRRICQVMMIATPNLGSTYAQSLRSRVARFSLNPQERTLCALNSEIGRLREVIRKGIIDAGEFSAARSPIPVTCFWGLNDAIVPEASAKGDFAESKPLRGDHFKVLKPSRIDDENYKLLAETILDPPGHKAFFELDDFQMHLTVEPRTPPEKILCKHGTHQRFVTTDNVAHLFRTATFSQRNRRRELFSMGYGTRSEGFVSAWGNTGNEAPSNEIGAWEDRGYTFSYQFRPQPGKTYTFNADIYRGYDPGSRDVHFHLKPDRRYRKIGVKLDLCSYLKANWKIVDEPALYLHSHDPGKCGEVCKQRVRKDAIMSQHTGTPGMYSWDFANISDGVIEVVWDVAQAAPKADAAGQGS